MARKIRNTLTNNFWYKLLAIALAFLLWLVVYNIEDPVKSKIITTTVSVENDSVITQDKGKWYDIVNGTNQVSFSISAKRSVLDKLDDTDFTAVADFKNIVISEDGKKGTVHININCTKTIYANSISYNRKNKYLEVVLEDFMRQQFRVVPETDGQVAEGYALGEVSVTSGQLITVSGPESIVSRIDKVIGTIDVSGLYGEVTDSNVIPVFYDEAGKVVPTTRLSLSNSTVSISAKILGTKEVPIEFNTTGTAATGSEVTSVSGSPSTVLVKGSTTALNKLTKIDVTGPIDIEGVTADFEKTIDITEFLPEGISLVNAEDANVKVTVRVKTMGTSIYSVSTDNITTSGLAAGYAVAFDSTEVNVTVTGTTDDLSALNSNQIKGSVDLSNLGAGIHYVSVKFSLDDSKYSWESTYTKIVISSTNDNHNDDDNNDDPNTDNGDSNNNDSPGTGEGNDPDGGNSSPSVEF